MGKVAAAFIDFFHENGVISFEGARTHLIGFSLGAHIAGHAGKNVRRGRIPMIYGLDPSGPLFSVVNPANRLHATDAVYVEVVHTNGQVNGIGAPIGSADFWPNGGIAQPGCLTHLCSHGRAAEYFIESLTYHHFFSWRCDDRFHVTPETCKTAAGWMGSIMLSEPKLWMNGSFYLEMNPKRLFGQGPSA